jgi:hypothetical protein
VRVRAAAREVRAMSAALEKEAEEGEGGWVGGASRRAAVLLAKKEREWGERRVAMARSLRHRLRRCHWRGAPDITTMA